MPRHVPGSTIGNQRPRLASSSSDVWNEAWRSGFDAFTIAQLMGHSDVRTTQRYVRVTELSKRAAVEAALLGHNLATRERKAATIVAVSA